MAEIIEGPVEVVRTDELEDVDPGDIRSMKLLTDLISKTKSSKLLFTVLESALIHNNLAQKQGGTTGEYNHLTNAELTKLQNLVIGDNGWINYSGAFTRDSTSQITITGVDVSSWGGMSIRIDDNGTITKHFIKTAAFSTNTVLTVTGDELPANIDTIEYDNGAKTVPLQYTLDYGSWETATNGSVTYQQALAINANQYPYPGAKGNITYVDGQIDGSLGTNPSGATMNIWIGAALMATGIVLADDSTVDCGVDITYANSGVTFRDLPKIYGTATGNSPVGNAAKTEVLIIVTLD